MKSLVLLSLLTFAVSLGLMAEENAACEKTAKKSVSTSYLSDKADQDALKSGVLEVVDENAEKCEAATECAQAADAKEAVPAEEENVGESTIKPMAGPAEIFFSPMVPVLAMASGQVIGIAPCTKSYAGMAVSPLSSFAMAGGGLAVGVIVAPALLLKGVFDTFTLGYFADEIDSEKGISISTVMSDLTKEAALGQKEGEKAAETEISVQEDK